MLVGTKSYQTDVEQSKCTYVPGKKLFNLGTLGKGEIIKSIRNC